MEKQYTGKYIGKDRTLKGRTALIRCIEHDSSVVLVQLDLTRVEKEWHRDNRAAAHINSMCFGWHYQPAEYWETKELK